MKIKFNSQLFKKSIKNEEYTFDENIPIVFYITNDLNFSKLKTKEEIDLAIEDYKLLCSSVKRFRQLIISGVPSDVLARMLENSSNIEHLVISNTELDFSELSNMNLGELKRLHLNSTVGENSNGLQEFANANRLENIEDVSLINASNLDKNRFFRDLPNPEKLEHVTISEPLPDPEIFSRFTEIQTLDIHNVKDANELSNFLRRIPLEKIRGFTITGCNMLDIEEDIFKRLESVVHLRLCANDVTNYNKIFSGLPNPEKIETVLVVGKEKSEELVKPDLLKRFENLNELKLLDQHIDLEVLHEYLMQVKRLRSIELKNINIQNLNFLEGIGYSIRVTISEESGIDLGYLTPDVVNSHRLMSLKDGNNIIETFSNGQESNTYSLKLNVESDKLNSLENLMHNAQDIESLTVDIPSDSNGLYQILSSVPLEKCSNGYDIILENFSVNPDDLKSLDNLQSIYVASKESSDRDRLETFRYDKETYKKIYSKIIELTRDIPEELPELDKFMIIYRRLGSLIVYDYGIINDNRYSEYAKQNEYNSRNCINGLLGVEEKGEKKCVCAGYSDILYNCLKSMGINAYKVEGRGIRSYHQWNKVILDGVCYNTDLTLDSMNLKSKAFIPTEYCLIDDDTFSQDHTATVGPKLEAKTSYDKKEVKKALKRARKFDHVRYNPIEDIKDYFSNLFASKNRKLLADHNTISDYNLSENKSNNFKKPSWEVSDDIKKRVNEQPIWNYQNERDRIANKQYEQDR